MKEIIRTRSLNKTYKDVCAVSDNNISVNKGEIYGFLGLNGAGKTTTIRMLLGIVKPTSGQALLYDSLVVPSNTNIWKKTGYLVEVPHSYPNLSVKENLHLIRKLRNLEDRKVVDRIMEKLEITSYANRLAKHLSLGNKQRLGLAKAMMHDPEIMILDEPTNGLDPAGIHDIRELLIDLAKNKGVTIFISSHILGEISQFATRIGIIHKGKMIREIYSDQLKELCHKQLVIQTNNDNEALEVIHRHGLMETMIQNNQIVSMDKKTVVAPDEIARLLISNNFKLNKLNVEEENLESFFLRTIKEKEAI